MLIAVWLALLSPACAVDDSAWAGNSEALAGGVTDNSGLIEFNQAYFAFDGPGGNDPANGFAQPAGPGIPLPNFDPAIDPAGGGLFEEPAQDQQINPGFEEEPADPLLPPHLAPWASNIPVGDEINIDEVLFGLNTTCREPILEGFVDAMGPFNPAAVLGETMNNARQPEMASWPNVNRVNTQGGFKPPSLRTVALTGPYFHTGSYLTLRQVVDFYMRGGDFPVTNRAHRVFLIAHMMVEDEALGGVDPITGAPEFAAEEKEQIIVSVVDFLLELTDERIAYQRAPFDQPEIFVPAEGTAPDNTFGRQGLMSDARFLRVPATGAGGAPGARSGVPRGRARGSKQPEL